MRKVIGAIVVFLMSAWVATGRQESGAAIDYINIYQKYISPLKHTHCRMYPSCSAYGKMVFSMYSFPEAMVLTADRLTRCGHDLQYYPRTNISEFATAVDFPKGVEVTAGVLAGKENHVSAPTIVPKDSVQLRLQFVNHLINSRNFSGALTEIERLLFFYPAQYKQDASLYVNKMKCFEAMGDYRSGLECYESLPAALKSDFDITYTAAHLLDKSNNPDAAIAKYLQACELMPIGSSKTSYGELAILYLGTSRYDLSLDALDRKYAEDKTSQFYISSIQVVQDAANAKRKNPWVARGLSIIPGCGYFYTESPSNAVAALLISAMLSYATYTSFSSGNTGVGIIVGLLDLSFYVGNIVGAGSSANRYNETMNRNAVNNLRKLNPYIN